MSEITSIDYKDWFINQPRIPDKESGHDHFSDAVRYFVDYEFPVRREIKRDPEPKRWGHR